MTLIKSPEFGTDVNDSMLSVTLKSVPAVSSSPFCQTVSSSAASTAPKTPSSPSELKSYEDIEPSPTTSRIVGVNIAEPSTVTNKSSIVVTSAVEGTVNTAVAPSPVSAIRFSTLSLAKPKPSMVMPTSASPV